MNRIIYQRHGITWDDFNRLLMNGQIVDGRAGGLLLGRPHTEGGIPVIVRTDGDTFAIKHEAEGGEYLVNWQAYNAAKARFDEINAHKEDEVIHLITPRVTPNSRLIHTRAAPSDKLLWVDRRGQFIINATATFRFLDEIEELNEKHNGFSRFDISETFV